MLVLSWVKSIPIELKSRNITKLHSFVGNTMSRIIMRKQYGNGVLKTDIDDHGNSNRKYQYKADRKSVV